MLRQQASSSLVVERADSGCFQLFRVMQSVPQGFYDQTDQRIRHGIRRLSLIETDRVMPARYRNRAGQSDESPDISHSFACRGEGCDGKKCPEARN